jgi:DNA-binding NarL/FixJ family response regulator
MQMLRLAIADDHHVLVEGLVSLFSNPAHGIEVVLAAANGHELVRGMAKIPVDVILLDLNMPGGDGFQFLPRLREDYPDTRVVIFTMYDQPKFIKEAFKLGAEGYILKGSRFTQIVDGLGIVAGGEVFLSEGLSVFPGVNGEITAEFEDAFLMAHSLTKREMEILALIARAKSNKDIAEELYISDQTVSVHRKNLMRKLKVSNSAGLFKFFVDHELFSSE